MKSYKRKFQPDIRSIERLGLTLTSFIVEAIVDDLSTNKRKYTPLVEELVAYTEEKTAEMNANEYDPEL